jgi:hypothetical protein
MKKHILISIVLLLSALLSAQTPAWVDFAQRQQTYPDEVYFTGFVMNELNKEESTGALLEKLKVNAVEALISTVQVTVESVSTLLQTQVNDQLSDEFKSASTSFSKIDLTGLHTETYFDKRNKMAYAIAWVSKEELIDYYAARLNQLKSDIAAKIAAADQFVAIDDEENALKAYYSCMPLFREAESAYAVIILLKAPHEQMTPIQAYEVEVTKGIQQVHRSDQLSLDELCGFLSFGLQLQTGTFTKTIQLGSLTFEDTRMSSSFSRRFLTSFQTQLIKKAGYHMVSEAGKPGSPSPQYLLSGTYWKDGNKLKVIVILRNVVNGKPLASAEGYLPLKWLTDRNINPEPENFGEAAENMKLFRKNEIVNGGMKLELWTNKGNDSPIFEENDTLQMYVRVNNACYVRIIDHMADGSKVLLVDNMYFGSDKVNKVVQIPIMFLCAPPFGAEFIQANAQTEPFSPLRTKSEYGYDFILNDLGGMLSNTRGFKKISNQDLKAEKRVVVTTMKRMN